MAVSTRPADNHEAMSSEAAQSILAAVRDKTDLLLCAAGGITPLRTYRLLSEHNAREPELFRSLRVVKLDEWGGLAMNDPSSCEDQLRQHLIDPLGLSGSRYFGFTSNPADPETECQRVRNHLKTEGPIHFCVLGLGLNGHIAMNEPASILQPFAHVARLAESSLRHPMLAGSRNAPTYGLTLGMVEILASREILLLVSGLAKREPLRQLFRRQVTTQFPASFLWLHSNWTLLCDRDAAGSLDLNA